MSWKCLIKKNKIDPTLTDMSGKKFLLHFYIWYMLTKNKAARNFRLQSITFVECKETHGLQGPLVQLLHCSFFAGHNPTSLWAFGPLIPHIMFPHTQSWDLNPLDEKSSLQAQPCLKSSMYVGLRSPEAQTQRPCLLSFKGYNKV